MTPERLAEIEKDMADPDLPYYDDATYFNHCGDLIAALRQAWAAMGEVEDILRERASKMHEEIGSGPIYLSLADKLKEGRGASPSPRTICRVCGGVGVHQGHIPKPDDERPMTAEEMAIWGEEGRGE